MTRFFTRLTGGLLQLSIRFYRFTFAYFLGGACRFTPSCSAYALEAIETHGPLKGACLAVSRLCRCRPGGGAGFDPVPEIRNPATNGRKT